MTMTLTQFQNTNMEDVKKYDAWSAFGWWDWFCSDNALYNRTTKFKTLAARLKKVDNVTVFLKNHCPVVGKQYDSMGLSDSDGNSLAVLEKRPSHPWAVYTPADGFAKPVYQADRSTEVADWINENLLK